MKTAYDISAIVVAIVAVIGLATATSRWFFKRGSAESAVSSALQENTGALRELTHAFDTFRTEAIGEFRQLDVRLTRLEANGNGYSPHRDLRSTGGYSPG